MLSIRLTGTPDEVADAVMTMQDLFPITAVKGLLPSCPRESEVRVYVEVKDAQRAAA